MNRIRPSIAVLLTLAAAAALPAQVLRTPAERFVPVATAQLEATADSSAMRTVDEPAPQRLALGPLSGSEIDRLLAAAATPLRIGIHRSLAMQPNSGVLANLSWTELEGGAWTASVDIQSSGAAGLRLALVIDHLPAGVEIHFAAADGTWLSLGEFDPADRPVWSPVLTGDSVRLEIHAPSATAARDLQLSIPFLSHLVQHPDPTKDMRHIGQSGPCNRDLACDQRRSDVGASVAKYAFESYGFTVLCTGQLLADTDPETIRYLFLTAAHCVATKREARSMTFFWHFQRAACEGPDPTTVQQTSGGARLRFTTGPPPPGTDHTLVELKRPPADGVVFSGWSIEPAAAQVRQRVWGIHHPGGDLKKVSKGKIRSLEFTHYEVKWRRGTTEPGSSGSGIWIGRRFPEQYLIGVLTGGFASCQNQREPDFYGQFVRTWNESAKFRKLLDPP